MLAADQVGLRVGRPREFARTSGLLERLRSSRSGAPRRPGGRRRQLIGPSGHRQLRRHLVPVRVDLLLGRRHGDGAGRTRSDDRRWCEVERRSCTRGRLASGHRVRVSQAVRHRRRQRVGKDPPEWCSSRPTVGQVGPGPPCHPGRAWSPRSVARRSPTAKPWSTTLRDHRVSSSRVTAAPNGSRPHFPTPVTWRSSTRSLAELPKSFCVLGGAIDTKSRGSIALDYTTNGGKTWKQGGPSPDSVGLVNDISCSSRSTCVAVGLAQQKNPVTIWKTTSGGAKWATAGWGYGGGPAQLGSLDAVDCPSTSECFAAGSAANATTAPLYTTTSGAKTWHRAALPSDVAQLDAITCASATHCMAVGTTVSNGPAVVVTTNGTRWASR